MQERFEEERELQKRQRDTAWRMDSLDAEFTHPAEELIEKIRAEDNGFSGKDLAILKKDFKMWEDSFH